MESSELVALVRDATAGLSDTDRAVIELRHAHDLTGRDLADAVGVPVSQVAKVLERATDRFERSVVAVVMARGARKDCPELAKLVPDRAVVLTPLLRKRISRHVDECDTCQRKRRILITPLTMIASAAVRSMPVGLRDRTLERSPRTWPRVQCGRGGRQLGWAGSAPAPTARQAGRRGRRGRGLDPRHQHVPHRCRRRWRRALVDGPGARRGRDRSGTGGGTNGASGEAAPRRRVPPAAEQPTPASRELRTGPPRTPPTAAGPAPVRVTQEPVAPARGRGFGRRGFGRRGFGRCWSRWLGCERRRRHGWRRDGWQRDRWQRWRRRDDPRRSPHGHLAPSTAAHDPRRDRQHHAGHHRRDGRPRHRRSPHPSRRPPARSRPRRPRRRRRRPSPRVPRRRRRPPMRPPPSVLPSAWCSPIPRSRSRRPPRPHPPRRPRSGAPRRRRCHLDEHHHDPRDPTSTSTTTSTTTPDDDDDDCDRRECESTTTTWPEPCQPCRPTTSAPRRPRPPPPATARCPTPASRRSARRLRPARRRAPRARPWAGNGHSAGGGTRNR